MKRLQSSYMVSSEHVHEACLDSFGSALRAETTRPIHSDASHPTPACHFSASSVSEWSRPSATLRREASWTAFRQTQAFASLHPSTSSASLNPTAPAIDRERRNIISQQFPDAEICP